MAAWSSDKELNVLKNSLDTIQKQAAELIDKIDARFHELLKEQPILQVPDKTEINPVREPTVTIDWNEHPLLKDGQNEKLDERQQSDREKENYQGLWCYKTSFTVEYQKEGTILKYNGRQDLGDGEGSLIDHIKGNAEHNLNDPHWQNFLAGKGEEFQEKSNADNHYIVDKLIPYFEMHVNLSNIEEASKSAISELSGLKHIGGTIKDLDNRIAYHSDILVYVDAMRTELNSSKGNYMLPDMPHLESYLTEKKELDTYKEQVNEEINQGALALGMTFNEYAKNDFEAPAERIFTIYQLKDGEENSNRRLESFESLQKQGEKPDIKNYEKVYTGKIGQTVTLENIYQEFNINRPEDFKGHSLSMSDIIVIEANGIYTANYVDTFGFKSCPDFARQHEHELNINDIRFDNVIDLNIQRSKKLSIADRMAAAREASKNSVAQRENPEKDIYQRKERGER